MKKRGFGVRHSGFIRRALRSRIAIALVAGAFAFSLAQALARDDDDDAPKKTQNAASASAARASKPGGNDATNKAPGVTPASSAQPASPDAASKNPQRAATASDKRPAAADDDAADDNAQATTPALNREQREAVGIVVARAVKAKPAERIAAFAEVLDPAALIGDLGEVDANRAAERAAAAEVARLQGLYKAGASASLKNLEAAQADEARAHAQAQAASARFALRWTPLASLPAQRRQKLIDDAGAGKSALVRVDLPGRQAIGSVPETATLDVDGIAVRGRVLGVLAQASESRSASLLAEIEQPPAGLAIGARIAATLTGASRAGYLVPRGALIYEEGGAFVYHELDAKPGDDKTQYARKKVTLLMQSGEGWLVDGLDDDDRIVVRGSGVLWSLEGIGAIPEDEDD